jgi:hypothetical protein
MLAPTSRPPRYLHVHSTYVPTDLFLQTMCTMTEYEGHIFVSGGFFGARKVINYLLSLRERSYHENNVGDPDPQDPHVFGPPAGLEKTRV